jgi:hypothetical protein
MQTYTRAQIVNGTGFARGARFVQVRPSEAFAEQSSVMTGNNLGWELRDWFAGQALTTIQMSTPEAMPINLALLALANHAYAIADAMLAARRPATIPDPVLTLDVEARRYLEIIQDKLDMLKDRGWTSDELQAAILWLSSIRERAHREIEQQGGV